jgi:hypothetical protein
MLSGICEDAVPSNPDTAKLFKPQTAVMLFYPVLSRSEMEQKQIPTMGFSLLFPRNGIKRRIRYGVRVKNRPTDVIVELPAQPGLRGIP